MESDQVQMYHVTKTEQPNNTENVILRSIVGDPNRHKPQAQHPLPATTTSQEPLTASMYTLNTRYQPIPPKVLPHAAQTRDDYLNADKSIKTSVLTTNEDQNTSQPTKSEVSRYVEEKQEHQPTIFLEPKIISQPVLYSVVGAKTLPAQNAQPIPSETEITPILYSITGQPHHPATNMNITTLNAPLPVVNKSPILHSLVGGPRLQVPIQESTKKVSQISQQQPSSSLYSVIGSPHQPQIQQPVKKVVTQPQQKPTPTLYSAIGGPHLQPLIPQPVKQGASLQQQNSPNLYSVIGGPRLNEPVNEQPPPKVYSVVGNSQQPPQSQEPVKQLLPTVYSIIGGPVFTQENALSPPPSTQPVKVSSVQPAPILYTIVGETQVPTDIPEENHSPLPPLKKTPNDVNMYRINGDPHVSQPITRPRKTQPEKQIQPPRLYPLVVRPNSPPDEDMDNLSRLPPRRRTPPPAIVPTRRISRSLERQPVSKRVTEDDTPMPPIKTKRQAKSKEPTISKSATIFIPLPEHERTPRPPRKPRPVPYRTSPGLIRHKPFNIDRHDPLRLSDYISPYAYHPSRPYREETYNPITLPTIKNLRAERTPRPGYFEPHYRSDHKPAYDPWSNHSLERYPVHTKRDPRLWDYEGGTQSDVDDYKSPRDKQGRRRIRPRTPWIPVW